MSLFLIIAPWDLDIYVVYLVVVLQLNADFWLNAELIYCWFRFKFKFNVADADYVFSGCTYCDVVILGQTEIFKMASKMVAATRDLLFVSVP